MRRSAIFSFAFLLAFGSAYTAPVRVLIWQFCGTTGYVHGAINSGTVRLTAMLKNPAAANLGAGIAVPADGYTVDVLGPAAGGNGTTDDGHAMVTALATHDVLILNNNTAIGNLLSTTDRAAFLAWVAKHGVVGFHGAADSHSLWPAWDSLTGGLFTSHVVAVATVALDSQAASVSDPAYAQINASVGKTASFNEEWYSYQTDPRSAPGVHVAATLDEKTYTPTSKMGDHPISWFRESPAGGRFYYTGIGHMQEIFADNVWFRRQVYNAIAWVGRVGAGPSALVSRNPVSGADAEVSATTLTVTFPGEGPHAAELTDLRGRRVAFQRGDKAQAHVFAGLRPNTVYALLTSTREGKTRRLITTQ